MSKTLPSRLQAIYTVIDEARADKVRKRAYARTSVALMVLGLNNLEVEEILARLELPKPPRPQNGGDSK